MGSAARCRLRRAGQRAGILNRRGARRTSPLTLFSSHSRFLCAGGTDGGSRQGQHPWMPIYKHKPRGAAACLPRPARELIKMAHLKAFLGSSLNPYRSLINLLIALCWLRLNDAISPQRRFGARSPQLETRMCAHTRTHKHPTNEEVNKLSTPQSFSI